MGGLRVTRITKITGYPRLRGQEEINSYLHALEMIDNVEYAFPDLDQTREVNVSSRGN